MLRYKIKSPGYTMKFLVGSTIPNRRCGLATKCSTTKTGLPSTSIDIDSCKDIEGYAKVYLQDSSTYVNKRKIKYNGTIVVGNQQNVIVGVFGTSFFYIKSRIIPKQLK
jgi:hypothetical protein